MTDRLPFPFALAPMAEVTTPALRRAITGFGTDVIIFSEMLSAAAISKGGFFNESKLATEKSDAPFIYQILGNDPAVMGDAAAQLSQRNCSGIDINMGCSAPDIRIRGWGSRLLQDLDLTRKIIRACRGATDKLLSVKMRSGFTEHEPDVIINYGKMFEEEGVDFITLHPRYAMLSFKRLADWSLVALLQKEVSIPVIGNGDITSPEAAVEHLKNGTCSAVMIGREAVKSPWIFKLANTLLEGREETLSIPVEKTFISILSDIETMLPPELHKSRGRRFASYYSKNARFGHALFAKIHKVSTIPEMISLVEEYYERNPGEAVKKFAMKDGTITVSG